MGFRRDGAVIAGCLELQVRVWAHLCFGSVTVEMENHKACLSAGLNELSVFVPVSALNCVCFSRALLFYTRLRKTALTSEATLIKQGLLHGLLRS